MDVPISKFYDGQNRQVESNNGFSYGIIWFYAINAFSNIALS